MSAKRCLQRLLLLVLGLLAVRPLPAAEPVSAGTVFVVGGVGGLDPLQASAPWALPHAGVPHRIEVFPWTHGMLRPLRDLQDVRYLLKQADRLAEAVLEEQARHPGRPIYLLGHSAGAALILAASEKLPPASVERMILLAAAVSPTYDLRPALRATRREVIAFSSTYDRLCLDWCTSLFGTADRVYGPAAGLDGFREPDDLDEEGRGAYRRLVQVPWHLGMIWQGTDGLHNGACMPIFLTHRIAPWLLPKDGY
ncbi:MAG TPA: alpha/beta hydrolase [Gemmataceae bacterium]|nr:alpha/beta hydrolase [Gemmataceae bacterium]